MSNWKVKDDSHWYTETREHFPFVFRINKSKANYGNRATVELYANYTESGPSGDSVMNTVKDYFDYWIAQEHQKQKRIADLEEKIKKLEEIVAASALDYQI